MPLFRERMTRLVCIFLSLRERKIKVWLGQALASGAHSRRIEMFEPSSRHFQKKKTDAIASVFSFGAGDEARTRYLHLGKVALYRMSYTRIGNMTYYSAFSENVKGYFCFFDKK